MFMIILLQYLFGLTSYLFIRYSDCQIILIVHNTEDASLFIYALRYIFNVPTKHNALY